MSLAPIVIFAYRRPASLQHLLACLEQTPEWVHSEVFIFIDAPKQSEEKATVMATYQQAQSLQHPHKQIFLAQQHKGLARAVIEGVSSVITEYGKAIVLEDDLECTADFLTFMNTALEKYKNQKQVFSLSGYSPPIHLPADYPHDLFLAPRFSSWGWGIWHDRWESIDWEVSDFEDFWQNPKARRSFGEGGEDLPYMLYKQQKGENNSWAIRACYNLYRQSKYCLYPRHSKCRHVYTKHSTHFRLYTRKFNTWLSTHPVKLPDELPPPDSRILRAVARYYRPTPWRRLFNRLRYG